MMCSFNIENLTVGGLNDCVFIIAEIGQNHQGDIIIAKQMILEAKKCGYNCVKFQKSCLTAKFTENALKREYSSPNSWGKTYGEHKQYLEFSLDQIRELQLFAQNVGILFSASAMDVISLEELETLNLPFIKIGSGDANNFPMLQEASKLSTPLIISTGMQNLNTVQEIVNIMHGTMKKNFALLHCVSSYPTIPENCRLLTIELLRKNFPDIVLGYSGHEEGVVISQAAVLLGAKILERHFTLDKKQKGSDHKCSLVPQESLQLIKNIRSFEVQGLLQHPINKKEKILNAIFGNKICKSDYENCSKALAEVSDKVILECELECRRKLGKSLVYSRNLTSGHILKSNDISIKVSEPAGITAELLFHYVGTVLICDVFCDCILLDDHIK